MCIVPPPCAPRRALVGSQPHWHSGPNQPLWDPMTLPQLQQFCRSGGVGGSTCTRPSRPGITREQHVSSCIEHVLRTHRELMENRGKLREIVTEPRKGLSSGRQRSPVPRSARKRPVLCWWRGLDSNQRTLARADLQSAAFNHSATSPRGLSRSNRPSGWQAWRSGRRAMWRRGRAVSTRVSLKSCRPFTVFRALQNSAITRWSNFGAGEGNRTLVVSLEGFCSTIELHPLVGRPMPLPRRIRQPISRLTAP